MYADTVDRKDACARIGLALKSLRVLEFPEAILLEQKLIENSAELGNSLFELISKNIDAFQLGNVPYRPTLALDKEQDPQINIRKARISQSLGFIIDLQDIALIPKDSLYPYYVVSPSISIGFDATEAASKFQWASEVMKQTTSPISVWKYWLKIRTNAGYEAEKGLGFPPISHFVEKVLNTKVLDKHIGRIVKRFDLNLVSSETLETETIVILAAACGRSHVFSRLYLSLMDAGDISIRNVDPDIELQFSDIERELSKMRMRLNLPDIPSDTPGFFWCNLEEGFSGLFGEITSGKTMIVSGITFTRKGHHGSLLEQDDPAIHHSNSVLVTRALMNEIVRWY